MTRTILLASLVIGVSFFPSLGISQTASNLQEVILSADRAFAGTQAVSSVTLTGQAERYLGPDHDTGAITLTARADGSSSVAFQGGSETRTDAQDTFANNQSCSWSGGDGTSHAVSGHNCKLPLAWFFPEIAFFSAQLPAKYALNIASGSNASAIAIHGSLLPPANASADQAALISHIGSYDLEFNESTFLPTALSYSNHPDSNAGVDIPVSVEFSDYRAINGAAVPFRIQRYFNGVLSLDITIADAVIAH